MNRSVERCELPASGTAHHQLQVGTFVHPTRGLVRCSAGSVLAASLRRTGHDASVVSRTFTVDTETPDGVLLTASYLDRDGHAVGFCVAANAADEAGRQAARDVVDTWSAVWRTRRVIMASLDQTCAGDAQELCPHVAMAQTDMRLFAQRGDQIVVIGRRDHAALPALLDGLSADVVVVEPGDDVSRLRLDPERVSYIVQPGMVIEDAAQPIAALRAHYPHVRGAHPDGLCYAASDDAATIRAVAASSDITLVLGSGDRLGALHPLKLAATENSRVHVIDDVDQILPTWLAGAASVGLLPTPSAQHDLEHAVLDLLSGLGPLSVVRRCTTTEVLTSWRTHRVPARRTCHGQQPAARKW